MINFETDLWMIPRQHCIARVKRIGSKEFVDLDLADLDKVTWFRPENDVIRWQNIMPYLPTDSKTCMFRWREIASKYRLVEVPTPSRFAT